MPAVLHVSAVQRPSGASAEEETSADLRRSKHRSADRGLPPPAALDELLIGRSGKLALIQVNVAAACADSILCSQHRRSR